MSITARDLWLASEALQGSAYAREQLFLEGQQDPEKRKLWLATASRQGSEYAREALFIESQRELLDGR